MEWTKLASLALSAVAGGALTIGLPALRRAVKNWGKTKVQIREENLTLAIKYRKEAEATPDPRDDVTATEIERRAKVAVEHAKELAAIANGLVGADQ